VLGDIPAIFFLVVFCKILMAKGLRARGMVRYLQNVEPQGLASKILWNKELALCAKPWPGSLAENRLG
jgi:hypothetical protein